MSESLLDFPPVSRTRRNHGLEHATLHILKQRYPHVSLGGVSSSGGFTIIGEVTTEDVAEAAIEALKRLRAGESGLALHPNCGTNFAVAGLFAGLGAWLGTLGSGKSFRDKLNRLPLSILLATVALALTHPVGPMVQKEITTDSDPEEMTLVRVETNIQAGVRTHRVYTQD